MILVPNLQHWLFLEPWLAVFPTASVGLVPSACDEDLLAKMPGLKSHPGEVLDLDNGLEEALDRHGLTGHHLAGAPLCLNEYLFFHAASGTLLASDSFYGGYADAETPTWFARLWFKLTKYGSFRAARLPVYRTSRVLSHGSEVINFLELEHLPVPSLLLSVLLQHNCSMVFGTFGVSGTIYTYFSVSSLHK